jgi:6-phosphogluconolactonase
MQWTVLDNPDAVAQLVCERIVQASRLAIDKRGKFHIVLTGGNTPKEAYALLAQADCDWQHWHIWIGDERCLPADDPHRNSVMIEQVLTSKVPLPRDQFHTIPAEKGPEEAARLYARSIKNVSLFDMVLLGMGEDGHVASLFPGHEHPTGLTVLPVHNSPKFPAERVSLSSEVLGQCRQMLFIIIGKAKADAVSRWRQGDDIPVSMIRGQGKSEVILDQQANGMNDI